MDAELSESAVDAALPNGWLGRHYHFLPETNSTNAALKQMVESGERDDPPHGTVLLADFQKRGRGRMEREWWAPPQSSLLLSILFRPSWPSRRMQWLMMIATLAAAEAIETSTALVIGVKWPNDLVIDRSGVWHKVSGLLVEGEVGANNVLETVVLGIGINVNIGAGDLPETATPWTSLMASVGQPVSRMALLISFLKRLEEYYDALEQGSSPLAGWKQRLVTLGQEVQASVPGGARSIAGVAEDTDAWGQLLIRDERGQVHTVSAGDVTLRQGKAHR